MSTSDPSSTKKGTPWDDPDLIDYDVAYEVSDAVAVIRYERPPLNHFSVNLIRRLAEAFEQADADPEIRATVLASKGKHFCAGADFSKATGDPTYLYEQGVRLFALKKPIVAAVQGAAVGGGLGLAVAADFRVVSPSTRFAGNFVKLGTHPGFGLTYTLPRLVGQQAAADMFYTGRRVSGTEAIKMGLADRLVPDEKIFDTALALASEIAENAPLAVEDTRATLRAEVYDNVRKQTGIEAQKQIRLKATEDHQEGVLAVRERRIGRWKRR